MGIVYVIRPKISHIEGHIYIGSTTQNLEVRYRQHKYSYNDWLSGKKDKYISSIKIFAMYGFDNCECIVIETVEDHNLYKKEKEHIHKNKCVNIITRKTMNGQRIHKID